MLSFQDILHHMPAHVRGWNPSAIMVVHFSVNTTIDKCVVRCDLDVHVRWRTWCGPGVT